MPKRAIELCSAEASCGVQIDKQLLSNCCAFKSTILCFLVVVVVQIVSLLLRQFRPSFNQQTGQLIDSHGDSNATRVRIAKHSYELEEEERKSRLDVIKRKESVEVGEFASS